MSLETLPPELWSMVFSFFTVEELFNIFFDLNRHFRRLLRQHQYTDVDLRAISRLHFNCFRQENLPTAVHQIISLRLSTDEDCLQQIYSFLSSNYPFSRFTQLQTLSLSHIYSIGTMHDLILQLQTLPNLTRLVITDFHSETNDDGLRSLINQIWNLPKLAYLHLHVPPQKPEHPFPALQIKSVTLTHLKLFHFRCRQNNLIQLFENTPHLHTLHMNMIKFDDNHLQTSYRAMSIKRIYLLCDYSWTTLTHFLQLLPNLTSLFIKIRLDIRFDGSQWENFITHHLPNLIRMRFVINYKAIGHSLKETQVKYNTDSFRSSFWSVKNNQCIRSDWLTTTSDESFYRYTLPYRLDHFHHFTAQTVVQSDTICSHPVNYHSYDNVHYLDYDNLSRHKSMDFSIRFRNIRHLSVTFPLLAPFSTTIPSFAQLLSLQVTLSNDHTDTLAQLQSVLAQAPRLYSIKFRTWLLSSANILEQVQTKSLRHLDLLGCSPSGLAQYFSPEQCYKLIKSDVLGLCEVLHIRIQKRESILDLVRNLNNLRVLVFECFEYKWEAACHPMLVEDDCLHWLERKLPVTYKASRDPNSNSRIRVWLQ